MLDGTTEAFMKGSRTAGKISGHLWLSKSSTGMSDVPTPGTIRAR